MKYFKLYINLIKTHFHYLSLNFNVNIIGL